MIQLNWTWTLLLAVSSIIALLLCNKNEDLDGSFLTFVLQVFVYGLCLWVICSIISKISGAFKTASSNSTQVAAHGAKYNTHQNQDKSTCNEERHEIQRLQQERDRQSRQADFDGQAEDYRKRILEPREEERKKRKERMLNHVIGGEGVELGYDESRPRPTSSERNGTDHNAARENRRLPDHVILHRPRQEVPKQAVKITKRVIKLPDEPDQADGNTVTIVLHTPLNQKYSRRFLCSSKLQMVFDYMTTLGFSQSMYTLTVAFPRQQLKDMVDKTLLDLKFGRRIVLHIDEDC